MSKRSSDFGPCDNVVCVQLKVVNGAKFDGENFDE